MPSSVPSIQADAIIGPNRRAAARLRTVLVLLAVIATTMSPPMADAAGDAPVAFDQSESTQEGQVLFLFLNASDNEFDSLTFSVTDPPDNGSLDGCASGTCNYTPNSGTPNFVGTDSFKWKANDGTSDSNEATFTITVVANTPPVASNESLFVFTDSPTALTLDASDAEFGSLAYFIVDPPDNGALDDCSFGMCTYTPSTGYTGPDSFTWKANDGSTDSNVATMSITVGDPIGRVVILDATVTGGIASREAKAAAAQGYAADVVDDTTWAAMTASQFNAYAAIVLGDPTCGGIGAIAAAEANRATWSSVVDGNVLIIGTDPIFHESQGGGQLTDSGMAYVLSSTGKTGLFVGLSCYYDGVADNTPVPLLDPFGTFEVGHADCFNDAHIVAEHPALAGLDDADLSDWSCSVHEVFQDWPLDFVVLAIAESFGAVYTAPDGSVGSPYILASGDITVASDIDLTPLSATNPIGTSHELTAVVSNTSGPIVGTTVTFTVVDGPHAGTTGTDATDSTGTATFSYTGTTVGTDTIKATFVDSALRTQTSNLVTKTWEESGGGNTAPMVDAGGPYTGNEGSAISLDGTVTDPDAGDTLTSTWTYSAGGGVEAGTTCSFGSASAADTTVTCTDDGTFTLTLTANDGVNSQVLDTATLTLANVDPTVDITVPADAAIFGVGSTVNLSADYGDAGANDTHTCSIDWGDGTTTTGSIATGACSGSHAYAAIGVYTVTVTVTDDDGGDGTDEVMVVVSDRTTKVTGGGFIVDGGRTSFGFVAKEDAAGLHGQLQVRAPGRDRFHGNTVTSLASSGNTASWSGTGRWNGVEGYTFEVSVVDNRAGGKKKASSADTIAITIRNAAGTIVFEASGSLVGGNITVH